MRNKGLKSNEFRVVRVVIDFNDLFEAKYFLFFINNSNKFLKNPVKSSEFGLLQIDSINY